MTNDASGATEPPQPDDAEVAADLVRAMRQLRLWSGQTYRQLEAKASAVGDVLPSSTVATALNRSTLPREQIVEAFVRACGLDEDAVQRWLAVRKRIAMQEEGTAASDEQADATAPSEVYADGVPPVAAPSVEAPSTVSTGRRAKRALLLASIGLAVLVMLGVGRYLLLSPTEGWTGDDTTTASASPDVMPLALNATGSFAQIRSAQVSELCLSEGRDRQGRYRNAVAALRPCRLTAPPRVFLEPVDAQHFLIEWHHPTEGIGCLTLLTEGIVKGMFEPWSDCKKSRAQQLFRVDQPGDGRYRLLLAADGQCLGLSDSGAAEGVEAVQETCSADPDQQFLIDLLPPP
ncbi:XRE family transcriptional regulator [Micromonospora rifamycinica]|uniref:RICIN domain-containing protein n=1 Tax=Micromonospora rifamycinica TaxID=291594 RepID=UPI002E2CC36E|nr:RICIN domain-containing protein [Micromonospora rifamycinica]